MSNAADNQQRASDEQKPRQYTRKMNTIRKVRLCGCSGIAGAVLLLCGDWLLFGVFSSGQEMTDNWRTILAGMPNWRLTAGGALGPIGAWFYAIGFWQVYLALEPAGKRLAFLSFAGLSMGMICIAGAFHASFPLMAYISESAQATPGLDHLWDRTLAYGYVLFYLCAVPILLSLGYMAYATLFRPTCYRRWSILFNPMLLYLSATQLYRLPAPFGGLLTIGYGNIMFLLFFALSTAVLWNGGRNLE